LAFGFQPWRARVIARRQTGSRMRVSEAFEKIRPAPVDSINAMRLSLEAQGRKVLNFGQAIPDLSPPPAALEALRARMEDRSAHVYTADQGLPELREELARSLQARFGGRACGAGRIIVTAGANHAFLITCMTLLEPGDQVGLLSPYFLNHDMIVRACGATPVELALPGEGNEITCKEVDRLIDRHRLRMVVMVNPSNPSGKVLSGQEIANIHRACRQRGAVLVADEVYRMFVAAPQAFHSAARLAEDDPSDNIIVIGSFSKEFGMSGWRVGWLQCPSRLLEQLMKAQDLSIICAPHAAQELALLSMRAAPDHALSKKEEYQSRRMLVLERLQRSGLFQINTGEGAFFIWFRPLKDVDSETVCLDLMARSGVCIMPGAFFGRPWRSWFRLSYGNARIEDLAAGTEGMVGYFGAESQRAEVRPTR
jgi:aminotransferase